MHRLLAVRVQHKMFIVLPGVVLCALYSCALKCIVLLAAVAVRGALVAAVLELLQS